MTIWASSHPGAAASCCPGPPWPQQPLAGGASISPPGSAAVQQSPAAGFGSPAPASNSAVPSSPPFGAAAAVQPPPPVPIFGGTTTCAPSFCVGATTGFGAATAASFSFGGAAPPSSSIGTRSDLSAGFGAAPAPVPGFGAAMPAVLSFGFGAAPAVPSQQGSGAASAPAFGFGLPPAPASSSLGAQPAPPSFGFGVAAAPSSTSASASPASPPVFGVAPAVKPPGFGTPSAPSFNFGVSSPQSPGFGGSPAPSVGFTASPAPSFGFGVSPASSPSCGAASEPPSHSPSNLTPGPASGRKSALRTSAFTMPASSTLGSEAAASQPPPNANGRRHVRFNAPYSTARVLYELTEDPHSTRRGHGLRFLTSISACSDFQPPGVPKSHEEMRWEDYQCGLQQGWSTPDGEVALQRFRENAIRRKAFTLHGTRSLSYNVELHMCEPMCLFKSVSALPVYQQNGMDKSHEELRWEDLMNGGHAGFRGGCSGGSSAAAAAVRGNATEAGEATHLSRKRSCSRASREHEVAGGHVSGGGAASGVVGAGGVGDGVTAADSAPPALFEAGGSAGSGPHASGSDGGCGGSNGPTGDGDGSDKTAAATAAAAAATAPGEGAGLGCLNVMEPDPMFLCPITYDVMVDPVVATDGYTYERSAITKWLKYRRPSPVTSQRMPQSALLIPNIVVRSAIQEWKRKTGQWW
ncbi:hypothetical protein Agub_g13059 [Astrephomene gubernaculifera]|uniref:U-box domain-containing protein n=1 Tax=Astrephomene gubernaculifera TaxID=47775 RepID=A0AAD3HR62_9CHLO|nr:hypothetical protein Agub_g13059 [Astrephomene gubernaculifera]